jgi:general secretion pathway protein D
VLIQVMLAEMTLDETNELGIDWNVTTKWNKGRDSVGAGTQIALAAQGDGFNLSVAAGDLTFFLRALQSQGRLEVLSRPQILASDNQLATINVGQKVPFITNSRITENGTTINTIEYQNVGIILTVTPRINPDGFVKLVVKPEISSIASSSVTISETTKAIVINQRSAETTVSVQDGHTIILGGLITTKDDHREDRVPWFGDWPLLGALFRGTTKVKERSELLIILTPHVLRTIPDADEMADEQIDRVNRIRKLKREEVEDYLKKHLDDLLAQKALKDKLNGQSPTTQPANEPASRPLRAPVRIGPGPVSGAAAPLPVMPMPALTPPQRADGPAGVSEASWRRAQEQFLAAIAADRVKPESTR